MEANGSARDRRARRQGFSLVEVGLALAVIAMIAAALMYSTVNTVSHSAKAEDLMLEALIAQTVVSEIKDASMQNPNFFANLTTKYQFQEIRPGVHQIFGSVTATRPDVSTPHGPLIPCNLFTDLPMRVMSQASASGPDLVDNLFSPLGYGQGSDPLSDFALRVTVGNQETAREFEGRRYYEGTMAEILKTVSVEIFRVTELGGESWKPAFRMSHAMLTPVESLSAQAAKDLDARHGTYDHLPVLEKLKGELRAVPTFAAYPPQALDLYALFMLILREVNVEYCKSEARSIITGRLISPRSRGLRMRIQSLGEASSGYLKLERGYLMQQKMLLTYDTFKRSIGPLKDLMQIMQDIDAQAAQLQQEAADLNLRSFSVARAFSRIMNVNGFNDLLSQFTGLQQQFGEQLQQQKQLLSTIRLMEYLLSRRHMEAAFERLRQYPAIFAADLRAAQDHFRALSQDREASPLVRAIASREWVALSIAWRVSEKETEVNSTASAHLALLKAANQGGFPLLEDHLDQNHLGHPLAALESRNEGFSLKQPVFKALAATDGPPKKISKSLEPAGDQTKALDAMGTTPGIFYRVVVSAARGARRVGMTPQEATARIGPTVDSLKPVVEETMALGLTNPVVMRTGAPASQLNRIGRYRRGRSWRPSVTPVTPLGSAGFEPTQTAAAEEDEDAPLPIDDPLVEIPSDEGDYDGPDPDEWDDPPVRPGGGGAVTTSTGMGGIPRPTPAVGPTPRPTSTTSSPPSAGTAASPGSQPPVPGTAPSTSVAPSVAPVSPAVPVDSPVAPDDGSSQVDPNNDDEGGGGGG